MRLHLDFLKDYFLEANPNPKRIGCPPERNSRPWPKTAFQWTTQRGFIWLRVQSVSRNIAATRETGKSVDRRA
jgi:hypothetical protein